MFFQACLAFEGNVAIVAFVKRKFTSEGNQISRYAQIKLTISTVKSTTLNKGHKNMVTPILNAYKSLNNIVVPLDNKLVNGFVCLFGFILPIK